MPYVSFSCLTALTRNSGISLNRLSSRHPCRRLFFFYWCIRVVAQPCLTLCDLMDCSWPCSSIHGIFQATVLEWVAISFSGGIFPTQGLNPGLLHCRQARYPLSHQGSVSGIDILVLFLMLVGRLFSLLSLSVKLAASFLDALYQVNWGSSCLFLVCWLFLFWNLDFLFFFGQMLFLTYAASKMTHFFVLIFSICRNWLAHQMCGGCGRKQGYSQSCKYQPFQRRCPVS